MPNFTKKEIKSAFLKLINEKTLTKISVKDVVDACGVSRNTFYYYFRDVPELLEEIIFDGAAALRTEYPKIGDIGDYAVLIFDNISKNRKAIMNIYRALNHESYESFMIRIFDQLITGHINEFADTTSMSDKDREMVIRLIKCTCIGAMIDWIDGGMKPDYAEKCREMAEFCSSAVKYYARKSSF